MNSTPRQLQALRFIYEYQTGKGYSPTLAEIARSMSVTNVTIFEYMQALERKGFIRRRRHEARSIELTDLGAVEVGKQARKDDREAVLLRVRAAAKKLTTSTDDFDKDRQALIDAISDSEKIMPEIASAPEISQEGAPT